MAPKRGLGKGLDSLIPSSVLKPVVQEKNTEENKEMAPVINKEEKESERNIEKSEEKRWHQLTRAKSEISVSSPILITASPPLRIESLRRRDF